ncbi:MAG TPA: ABC transporter permease [Mycobacteriales bacterium]|jgi:peptide/nickel transport system permease protein|nr:ABC transporter permease [Mycobacteriales bacterium]
MRLRKYLLRKLFWYLGALVAALILNFLLPRLVPGNPVDSIVATLARGGGAQGEQLKNIQQHYVHEFGLDKSMLQQFFIYLGNLAHGDLGSSFAQYPASVRGLIDQSLPWSIALQVPAILIGWIVGNVLGAVAAFKAGWFDRSAFLGSLFMSSMPYYCLAILLLYLLAVAYPILPIGGGYDYGTSPELTIAFVMNALHHYWLPFLSLVVVFIGGQAVGMRSMAIYELGSDYVNFGRGLGLPDKRIVRYIFRNAMLPQVTGLALSVGTLVGGALLTELVFSYPGIGTLLFNAISQNDYPVIQGITLIIAIAVLGANFLVDVVYGFIDPRIRAAQEGER